MRLRNSYLLLVILFVISCTPQRRITRLIDKYPYLITTDTVTIIDTVTATIPSIVHDTVVNEHFFHEITKDTLILEKDRLTVKIFHDTVTREVYIKGECDTVTIEKIVERKIPVKYYEKTPLWKKVMNWLIFAAIVYGVFRLVIFVKKKI